MQISVYEIMTNLNNCFFIDFDCGKTIRFLHKYTILCKLVSVSKLILHNF